ncbi:hypothetical protein QYM36_004503 [Artemia franciscana]|uniref:Uncharacterized protein n=1 Tax=Artemia franciscana TaxID=6661 RepID=A0AA88L6U4_ARTSF|nr:hypothetical protein QYM36_004503 [Artemia franciscana]
MWDSSYGNMNFGKRSSSSNSGPRRENECLVLEPSEILIFDYPETQSSKIHPAQGQYSQQIHQRILPVPGHFPYYQGIGYAMDPSVMLRGHARMVESEDQYSRNDLHTLLIRGHSDLYAKSQRSSRGSDTSSAYSGSDTLHSIQSSIETEQDDIDLSGLKESLVDSDEEDDLADIGTVAVRDTIQLCLEKDPSDRTEEDIEILLEFTQQLKAFSNMTLCVRKDMCRVMVSLYLYVHICKSPQLC